MKYFYQKKRDTQIHIKIVDEAVGDERDRFYEMFSPIADRVFVESVVPLWTDSDMKTGEVEKINTEIRLKSSNAVRWSFIQLMCCRMERYTRAVISDRHLNLEM